MFAHSIASPLVQQMLRFAQARRGASSELPTSLTLDASLITTTWKPRRRRSQATLARNS
jgi:hypothetical protein